MMKLSEAGSDSSPRTVSAWSKPSSSSSPSSSDDRVAPKKRQGWIVWLASLLVVAGFLIVAISAGLFERNSPATAPTSVPIPATYDPDRAMSYLVQLCDFGRRPSGSEAMRQQQTMLQQFFAEHGAQVSLQTFEIRHPEDGSPVPMANLVASWGAGRPKRFLLCAHYDTRPFPDRDRKNPRGTFIGANDGASGTAALMELAHQMKDLPVDVGVDIVLFDGEEFVFQQGRDDYFLGSNFFAEKYKASPPSIPYRCGVLLDMVGDRNLKIYFEQNSLKYARSVAKDIWNVADDLGVDAFVPRSRHQVEDDHIPLNQIAKIPTVDLIDFDYPQPGFGVPSYWHTENDVPANCSGQSLAAVVWVVDQWLKRQ